MGANATKSSKFRGGRGGGVNVSPASVTFAYPLGNSALSSETSLNGVSTVG